MTDPNHVASQEVNFVISGRSALLGYDAPLNFVGRIFDTPDICTPENLARLSDTTGSNIDLTSPGKHFYDVWQMLGDEAPQDAILVMDFPTMPFYWEGVKRLPLAFLSYVGELSHDMINAREIMIKKGAPSDKFVMLGGVDTERLERGDVLTVSILDDGKSIIKVDRIQNG
ncbi:MAG TPA: hypothetical protein VLF88_00985 [Candidatus Babeliales bacterium]|nr:hypothetical protein [Candidatus Babeliales bacterium]